MEKPYLVFVIQGYESEEPAGNLHNSCVLELIDVTYENALKRAKKLITKKFYRLASVIEKYK